jgi:site-specific recombinase XerD
MYSRTIAASDEEKLDDLEVFEASIDQLEREALERSLARNTNRAYESDWRDFTDWCDRHAAKPLPADARTLKRYMLDRSQSLSKATLERRIASISRYHKEAGAPVPRPIMDSAR